MMPDAILPAIPSAEAAWSRESERAALTPPAAAVVAAVSGQPLELVRPLMESLESDLLPHNPAEAPRLYGIHPLRFDRAVDRALREWESLEPLGAR